VAYFFAMVSKIFYIIRRNRS